MKRIQLYRKLLVILNVSTGILLLDAKASLAQQFSESIRLNQVGFYPNAPKIAVITAGNATTFYVKTPDLKQVVFEGIVGAERKSAFSEKTTHIADFSTLQTIGKYVVEVPSVGYSYPFEISPKVHQEVAKASIKAFYYQRVSTDLPEKYAGKWARPTAHPDDKVLIHASAVSANRPENTVISSPRGWYDAGDYNKYIVNSGITMGTLFSLYEDFPTYFQEQNLNIPESNNTIPDLLDESLWNLRWMLTMQDTDGGVYHKLTNANFDNMVMPIKATKTRYVVEKGTAATLDFAAVTAQAARIFSKYPQQLPGLADSCLQASIKAWNWAIKNPAIQYQQDKNNEHFLPKITTGAYGDNNFKDEFIWAAAELYITTKQDYYYQTLATSPTAALTLPAWNSVGSLAYYSLARHQDNLTNIGQKDLPFIKQQLITLANTLIEGADQRSYQTVMGKTAKDYIWGSSAVAANQSIAILQAYYLTNDKKYLAYAGSNLDYLLGRNPTGYSFLTGYGTKTPMHPHHRLSIADGIVEPIPGLLSGGTNAGQQDKCAGYPNKIADECYLDADCSYASNEIAINWNAPMAYLSGAMEAIQTKIQKSLK